ncbi:MAG: DUF2336 domain-containing protein [Rhodospirillales bacterium]
MSALDAQHLLELAHRKTAEGRSLLASTVADVFGDRGEVLTDRERSLMYDILHKVIVDVEMSVRVALSDRLADSVDAPRALIKLLANDAVEVAYPVLTRSRVLHDQDLIEVVRHRTLEHQLAVANRYSVSEPVSSALVETGEPSVIETLLNNQNAKLGRATLEYLVDESKRYDSFREPILRRSELGADLAKRMYLWVSAALREFILGHFDYDRDTIDELLEKTAFEQIDRTAAPVRPGSDALAEGLAETGKITPAMLVDAMRQGEINLFAAMLGRKTGLCRNLVMRLLFESGGEGLAIACIAHGIDRETVSTLLTLSRRARPRHGGEAGGDIEAVLALYDATPPEAAIRIVRRWQRNPDYQRAIEDLKNGAATNA